MHHEATDADLLIYMLIKNPCTSHLPPWTPFNQATAGVVKLQFSSCWIYEAELELHYLGLLIRQNENGCKFSQNKAFTSHFTNNYYCFNPTEIGQLKYTWTHVLTTNSVKHTEFMYQSITVTFCLLTSTGPDVWRFTNSCWFIFKYNVFLLLLNLMIRKVLALYKVNIL